MGVNLAIVHQRVRNNNNQKPLGVKQHQHQKPLGVLLEKATEKLGALSSHKWFLYALKSILFGLALVLPIYILLRFHQVKAFNKSDKLIRWFIIHR